MAGIPLPERFGLSFALTNHPLILFSAFSAQDNNLVPALIYHVGRVMFSIASARDKDRGAAADQTMESLDDLGARLLSLCIDTQTREM
jgi:hypothetical protein